MLDRGDEPSLTGAKLGGQLNEAGVEFRNALFCHPVAFNAKLCKG